MITTIVQFQLPSPVSREKAQEIFSGTAPKYQEAAGLIRKYYLISGDGSTAGGVYLWKSRDDADNWYTPAWREHISRTYGADPQLQYFDTPVVVDNVTLPSLHSQSLLMAVLCRLSPTLWPTGESLATGAGAVRAATLLQRFDQSALAGRQSYR